MDLKAWKGAVIWWGISFGTILGIMLVHDLLVTFFGGGA